MFKTYNLDVKNKSIFGDLFNNTVTTLIDCSDGLQDVGIVIGKFMDQYVLIVVLDLEDQQEISMEKVKKMKMKKKMKMMMRMHLKMLLQDFVKVWK